MTDGGSKPWHLPHHFDAGNPVAERGARRVLWITLLMMLAEIIGGWWFNSMALLADGWHMSSHAVAMGMAWLAYVLARRHAMDPHFAWGTWKIEILGSYSSALILLGVAVLMVWGSIERLLVPLPIRYGEAITLAAIGLLVNVLCAWILHGAEGHDHDHDGDHEHHDHHGAAHHHGTPAQDLNLRAAYVHVLTDALTSVLAIVALLGGSFVGWDWLDPLMGVVGAVLVAVWAVRLLRDSGAALLDRDPGGAMRGRLEARIAELAAREDVTLSDLHVWRVGRARHACIVGLVTRRDDLDATRVRPWLADLPGLYHINVEINRIRS